VVTLCIVSLRLHELFPFLAVLRPALLVSVGGTALLLHHSRDLLPRAITRDRLVRAVAIYFGWILVTAPFALWPGRAVQSYNVFVPVLLLSSCFALCAPSLRNLEKLQIGFVAGTACMALRLLLAGNMEGDRLSGIGGQDSNDLAALMAFTFPHAIAIALRNRGRARLLAIGTIPLLAIAIAATASRGGAIALVAGTIVVALGLRGARRPLILIGLVVGGVALWQFGPPAFRERMSSLASLDKDYNFYEYTGREAVWGRARKYYSQNLVTGLGFENFPVAEGRTLADMGKRGAWMAVHNAYLQAFVELGTPGGLIYLGILGSAALAGFRLGLTRLQRWHNSIGSRPEYLASIASFCTSAYFLSHAYSWLLFGLLGLIFFAYRVASTPQGTSPAPPLLIAPRSRKQAPPRRHLAPLRGPPTLVGAGRILPRPSGSGPWER
jgi:O-antigen ligase